MTIWVREQPCVVCGAPVPITYRNRYGRWIHPDCAIPETEGKR